MTKDYLKESILSNLPERYQEKCSSIVKEMCKNIFDSENWYMANLFEEIPPKDDEEQITVSFFMQCVLSILHVDMFLGFAEGDSKNEIARELKKIFEIVYQKGGNVFFSKKELENRIPSNRELALINIGASYVWGKFKEVYDQSSPETTRLSLYNTLQNFATGVYTKDGFKSNDVLQITEE